MTKLLFLPQKIKSVMMGCGAMPTILFIAFFVRFYRLSLFPINHDEATWVIPSIYHFDRFMGIPVACFGGYIQPLFSYLVILTAKLFSSPVLVVRLPSVFIGLATVLAIYYLAAKMYDRKAGLISSFLLSILPWHVIQSRVGVTLILTPLFGCLIFSALFNAIHKKSNLLLLLSFLFLAIGSFYTYQASLCFIPVFFITLWFLRRDLRWVRMKSALLNASVFIAALFPLIYLQINNKIPSYGAKVLGMFYNSKSAFGNFLYQILNNIKNNIPVSFNGIFFKKACILNGQALDYPLLISGASFFMLLFSVALSLFYRKDSDRILLVWLIAGYLCAAIGVKHCDARYYITVILPPLLIFIAKFIAGIFDKIPKKVSFKREALLFSGITFLSILLVSEIWQVADYFHKAPSDLEECRFNSYGCKEAAQYLSKIPDIENYNIQTDTSMEPLFIYLNYYLKKPLLAPQQPDFANRKKCAYYLLWAPQTHPEDWREGQFSWLWKHFRPKYPDIIPEKIICYPNGLEAVYIFKVEGTTGLEIYR